MAEVVVKVVVVALFHPFPLVVAAAVAAVEFPSSQLEAGAAVAEPIFYWIGPLTARQ